MKKMELLLLHKVRKKLMPNAENDPVRKGNK